MSYCELFAFKSGEMFSVNTYRNSYGFFSFVWSKLWNKYTNGPFGFWMTSPDELRALQDNNKLSRVEKIVFLSTFDYAMIKSENFEEYANLLEDFLALYPSKENYVCHLNEIASDIRSLINEKDIKSIGFYRMSVSDNPWCDYNEETDDYIGYNIDIGNKHWFVEF